MSTESSQTSVLSSISLPEITIDPEYRQDCGRDVSSTYSRGSSKSVAENQRRNVSKEKKIESWASLTVSLMIETLLLGCISFGAVFAYINAPSAFFYVVMGLLGLELLYYIVSIIVHFMDIESAFNFIVPFTLMMMLVECAADMYFLFSDISESCDKNGCTFFNGPAVYRFSFCMFVIFVDAIHVIFVYVFMYDMHSLHKQQQKEDARKSAQKESKRSKSRSKSRRSRRHRRSTSRSRSRSRSIRDDSSVSRSRSRSRSQSRRRRRSVQTDDSQSRDASAISTKTETTGPSFVPISQRLLSQQVSEPSTVSRSERSTFWNEPSRATAICPVARGQCTVPTCPYYCPQAVRTLPQVTFPGTSQSHLKDQNRSIVVDLPPTNNNQNSVEFQRIIVRLPGETSRQPPVQQLALPSSANPQQHTFVTTVTPMDSTRK